MARNRLVQQPCPICADPMSAWMPPQGDCDVIDCPTCGKMHITGTAMAKMTSQTSCSCYVEYVKCKIFEEQLRLLDDDWLLVDTQFLRDVAATYGSRSLQNPKLAESRARKR